MLSIRSCRLVAHLLLLLLIGAADVAAQTPSAATPFLAPDHWALAAARRLSDLGAAPDGYDPGLRAYPVGALADVFARAAASAQAPSFVRSLATSWADRLEEETGVSATAAGALTVAPLAGRIAAGVEDRTGRVATGVGYFDFDWTGAEPLPDARGGVSGLRLSAAPAAWLAVVAEPRYRDGDVRFGDTNLVIASPAVGLWAGRRTQGYGIGASGGIVLAGGLALDGAGFFTARPFRLPWVLRHIGPATFELFGTRLTNGDIIRDPWFAGGRFHISPHDRLGIGLSRGAMFGGEGGSPVTLRNLVGTLVGAHTGDRGDFATQVAALDVRYRPPSAVPLVFYAEWGFADTSGAYHRSPGLLFGLDVPAVPGLPAVAFGIEHTRFSAAGEKNPRWYRNLDMRGGWTDERRPLGHPLGGHGREWLVHGRADVADARLRVAGRAYVRSRGEENLYAPERAGRSLGGAITLEARLAPGLDLAVGGVAENGRNDWTEQYAFTELRWRPGATGRRASDRPPGS